MPSGRFNRFVTICALSVVTLSPVLSPLLSPVRSGATPAVQRLAGADQYATALAVSHGWTSASSVVVASGDAWPDAIAASSLGRPVILTGRDALPSGAPDELRRLGAREAVVVGGTDAIGPGVRDQLRSMGLSLVEVAGADRYDTAAHVATLVPATGDAIVASGETWPDAVAIAAWAAARHVPVFLTTRDALPAASAPARRASRVIVIGGPGVVSDAVLRSLPNPTRLAGADRYDTSGVVAAWSSWQGLNASAPVVVPGDSPSEALVGGVLAGHHGSPSLMTAPDRLSLGAQEYLARLASSVGALDVVGRTDEVGDAAVGDASVALQSSDVVSWVDAYRQAHGAATVTRDGGQDERALAQSIAMMRAGALFHSQPTCNTWGEDVGTTGADARAAFDAWTQSPEHESVLRMGGVRLAGTAALTGPDGRRWVVLDLCG